jgi:hypothetical protein
VDRELGAGAYHKRIMLHITFPMHDGDYDKEAHDQPRCVMHRLLDAFSGTHQVNFVLYQTDELGST